MRRWTASTTTGAAPDQVLAVLTDPDACRRWAPIGFDVDDDLRRLDAGTRTRVSGRLAGRRLGFEVEVHRADEERLALTAEGPVRMDVVYELAPVEGGSQVQASVAVHPGRGLLGVVIAEATNSLLKAGALSTAMSRLAREAVVAA